MKHSRVAASQGAANISSWEPSSLIFFLSEQRKIALCNQSINYKIIGRIMAQKRKISKLSYLTDDDEEDTAPDTNKTKYLWDSSDSDSASDTLRGRAPESSSDSEDSSTKHDAYTKKGGPRCDFSSNSKPIKYFELFFDLSLCLLMVDETNKYAELSTHKSHKNWKPVTVLEMKAFMAVLLEMSLTQRPNIYSYWAEDARNIPWFRKMFSLHRFQAILKYFRLVDNSVCLPTGNEKIDPCVYFEPLLQHVNRVFKLYYTPHEELTIDEVEMLHHPMTTQLLTKSRHHKFWMLCDAMSKYCFTYYRCDGAKVKRQGGFGYDVAVNLLKEGDYLNKRHHIYVDSFFSSVDLAKYLLSKNTYLSGIIRSNRKYIPEHLKISESKVKYFQDKNVLFCAYRENENSKKPVLFISTQSDNQNVTITKTLFGREMHFTKPSIVHYCNTYIGDYDNNNLYTFFEEHRTVQHWKKAAFHIIGRMVYNAYIIYKETVGANPMPQLDFVMKIIFELESEWMEEKKKEHDQRDAMEEENDLVKSLARNLQQCLFCDGKTSVKWHHFICVQCKKEIHQSCFDKLKSHEN